MYLQRYVLTIAGGRLSDNTVKPCIWRRNGVRLPEDRLQSGVVVFSVLVPTAYLPNLWVGNAVQPLLKSKARCADRYSIRPLLQESLTQ